MDIKKELQELDEILCSSAINTDVVAGWNAAKDGFRSPPDNFSRDRQRDWSKGNNAFFNRSIKYPKQVTEKEAYKAGRKSYFRNNGKLVNPYKGQGEIGLAFENGWAQALRSSPTPKFDPSKRIHREPNTFQEKYSKTNRGYRPAEASVNEYKRTKDGE